MSTERLRPAPNQGDAGARLVPRQLSEFEVEEALKFASGTLAAAGHVGQRPDAERDIRAALRGEIAFDEVIERAAARARR